jgi:hypothetical protein
MIVLIGSVATNYHIRGFRKEPGDMDILCDYDTAMKFKEAHDIKICYPINSGKTIYMKNSDGLIIEASITWPDSMEERLYKFIESQSDNIWVNGFTVPSLDVLYLLKMSHRYKKDSPVFKKTLDDILTLRKHGAKIRDEHMEFFKEREKDTYNYSLPKLNQSKADFFDNSNNIYTLDHDCIHEAIALGNRPAYLEFKPDENEVYTSKALFFAQPKQIQLNAAYEEICVLSLERSIHPFPDVDRKWAFDKAQMKLSTSISSGWFREFCWEHYYEIQTMYNVEYVDRFYEALYDGRIKPFKGY